MQRYILVLAYKGTNFHGWQIQKNSRSVQEELINSISIILKEKINLIGAGRTDTGVHASFYLAHFDAEQRIENKDKFLSNINGILDNDIAIYDLLEIDQNFNSRFDAVSRTYKYFINRIKEPFQTDYSYYFKYPLNIDLMNKACEILKEYEDFKSFEKLHSDTKTSICKIFDAKWTKNRNQLIFTIKADRFLRNMVRSIVGTMIDIGRNKISLEDFKKIIESKNRQNAGASAKAHGLFLVDIEYPEPLNSKLDFVRKQNITLR